MADSQRPHLLTIAPELRNLIYHEVAFSVHTVILEVTESQTDFFEAANLRHPLASVCRQLRLEAKPVIQAVALATAKKYEISMTAFDFEQLSKLSDFLLDHCGRYGVSSLKQKTMRLDFKLGLRTLRSLEETLTQYQEFVNAPTTTRSPFRYTMLFKFPYDGVTFRFNLRTKAMSPTAKSQTVTHDQLKKTSSLWADIDYKLCSHEKDGDSDVFLICDEFTEAYHSLRSDKRREYRVQAQERKR